MTWSGPAPNYTKRIWGIYFSFQGNHSSPYALMTPLGHDSKWIENVDLNGNPVSEQDYKADAESVEAAAKQNPQVFHRMKYTYQIFQSFNSVQGAFVITSDINPAAIKCLQMLITNPTQREIKNLPTHPKP